MMAKSKNANAHREMGESVKQKTNTTSRPNNSAFKTRNQPLRGMQGYEFLKRAFTEANPNSTASEYDQACFRFARMAGV